MDKVRTRKALSVAAAANLAVAGFAASPANAVVRATPGATGATTAVATVPSAGRTHPGLLRMHRDQLIRATATRPRGFVPRARAGVKPDTASTCNGDVCIKVWGAGLSVYAIQAHWRSQPGVCRDGKYISTDTSPEFTPTSTCFYSHQQTAWVYSLGHSFFSNTSICAEFNNVPGRACVHLG
jgi:hypothetical protein